MGKISRPGQFTSTRALSCSEDGQVAVSTDSGVLLLVTIRILYLMYFNVFTYKSL